MTQKSEYHTTPNAHLLKAMYNWIIENDGIPHIVVPLSEVPTHLHRLGDAASGTIVFNIGPRATGGLNIGTDTVTFSGRFNGVATTLEFPTDSVGLIYDREQPTAQLLMPTYARVSEPAPEQPAKRPSLSVVK
jgi:stringent starvation protein B